MSIRLADRRSLTAALVLAAGAGMAMAAPGTLRLRHADVDLANRTNALETMRGADPTARGAAAVALGRFGVVQLDGPMTPERRAALTDAGVRLIDYLPDHAYSADLRRADWDAVGRLGFVAFVGGFDSAWKVDPELGARPVATPERVEIRQRGRIASHVYLFPGVDRQATLDAIRALGGVDVVTEEFIADRIMLQAELTPGAQAGLARIEGVQWIEEAPEVTPRLNTMRWIVQSNQVAQTPVYDAGITGTGQLIAVMDGRVDVNHCSFRDPEGDPIGPDHRKIEAYNTSQSGFDFHGTHVAGIALGDGGSFTSTRGVAFDSRLVFNIEPSFSQPAMYNRLEQHAMQGAAIHVNSWGNDFTTAYDGLARAIDLFSWMNDDNLVIFAVTNGSVLRNPENAKDVLAVGATDDSPFQHTHCSGGIGPTSDGRRKPEIYAPGCGINAPQVGTTCQTMPLGGTSMAAPAIGGSAALIRQYFTDGYYPTGVAVPGDGFIPSGALLKAMLLNSTVDMTGVSGYPTSLEGWGRVLLDNVLYFPGDTRSTVVHDVRNNDAGALSTDDSFVMPVEVTSSGERLKVTLVWHDAPAAVQAAFAPVNNLDLEVAGPMGTELLGNVFDTAGGVSRTGGTADLINNVEMVVIDAPTPGTYTIRVNAASVNEGAQGFAVVVSGDVATDDCPADINGDDELNFFDVSAFLTAFNDLDPIADFNDDGDFNFFDVSAFIAAFNLGCE